MKIFLAGASGAIGRPLVRLLREAGHDVTGTARTAEGQAELRRLGCAAVAVDVFDADKLARVVADAAPDVVIHQLTALPRDRAGLADPAVGEANARIRREGTPNLVRAAEQAGAKRIIAQSIAWAYAPKTPPYFETDPLDVDATGARAMTVAGGIVPLETAVLTSAKLEGVVLRYGLLYGPGTWAEAPAGPSPLHVEAAAFAALLATDRGPSGIYNVAEPQSEVSSEKAMRLLGWRHNYRLALPG
jgi:nucleoside-diphosphate-sugar epimerase